MNRATECSSPVTEGWTSSDAQSSPPSTANVLTLPSLSADLPLSGARNVRDDDRVEAAIDEVVDHFGGIDICVNNASAIDLSPVESITMKRYDLMQDINNSLNYQGGRGGVSEVVDADARQVCANESSPETYPYNRLMESSTRRAAASQQGRQPSAPELVMVADSRGPTRSRSLAAARLCASHRSASRPFSRLLPNAQLPPPLR
jgi:NAD(P)-dependent dehydrogenase (short-subunit alcohol dehydrogenase family)